MNISREELQYAVVQRIITNEQAAALWELWKGRLAVSSPASGNSSARFTGVAVVQYLGALVVLAAMWWLADQWQHKMGAYGLFWISLVYGCIFFALGSVLWKHPVHRVGGGLLYTLAVCMVPLIIYGWEVGSGLWPASLEGKWELPQYLNYESQARICRMIMEGGTIIAAAVLLYFVPFPFLTAPLFLAIWMLAIDGASWIFPPNTFMWDEFKNASLMIGLVILFVAYKLDGRTKEDYSFWGYFFGLLAFWTALTAYMPGASQMTKGGYLLINVGLLIVAALLNRKVFLVFGALGVLGYLSYLAYDVFADSLLFPIVLSLLGLATLYLGVLYQRHQKWIQQRIVRWIPASLRGPLPR